jgi:hypothetical protein
MLSHPLRRKINPAAIPTLFDFLLDHLFTVDFELGLVVDIDRKRQGFKVRSFSLYHTVPQTFNNYNLTI